jgi:protein tyrosine phosphatase (PTP) superfamily phosphohydrolase (DUF442 family)
MMCVGLVSSAVAAVSDISNFREYSEQFASSGQPTKLQLQEIKDAGFERIVYIAFTSSGKAYDDEDERVKELGMDYIQIPVDWEKPTRSDFYAFAGVMQTGPTQKTLLHCQVNFRASAFSFLYRVVFDGVSVAEAKADMNSVWEPNETWVKLIFDVLEENDISPHCDGCDWTSDMQH